MQYVMQREHFSLLSFLGGVIKTQEAPIRFVFTQFLSSAVLLGATLLFFFFHTDSQESGRVQVLYSREEAG